MDTTQKNTVMDKTNDDMNTRGWKETTKRCRDK